MWCRLVLSRSWLNITGSLNLLTFPAVNCNPKFSHNLLLFWMTCSSWCHLRSFNKLIQRLFGLFLHLQTCLQRNLSRNYSSLVFINLVQLYCLFLCNWNVAMHVLKLSSVDLEELTKRLNHLTLQSTEAPTISGVGLNVDEGGFRNEFLNPRKVIGFCFFFFFFPFWQTFNSLLIWSVDATQCKQMLLLWLLYEWRQQSHKEMGFFKTSPILNLDVDGSLCEGLTDVDYTLWKTQEATLLQCL